MSAHGIIVLDYTPIEGKVVKAKLTLLFRATGLILPGCTLQERDGKQEVRLPDTRVKRGESYVYEPIAKWSSDEYRNGFSAVALKAIDEYLQESSGW